MSAGVPPPLETPKFPLNVAWHERYHHDAGHAWFRRAVAETLDDVETGEMR